MTGAGSQSRVEFVAGWAFMILLGPLHFTGGMVGPAGGFSWRQWVSAFVGSLLWVWVGVTVIGYV